MLLLFIVLFFVITLRYRTVETENRSRRRVSNTRPSFIARSRRLFVRSEMIFEIAVEILRWQAPRKGVVII